MLTFSIQCYYVAGATLGKGLNRVMATLTAAGLTVGTHHLAILCNKVGEAVVIGLFVFIIGKHSFIHACF